MIRVGALRFFLICLDAEQPERLERLSLHVGAPRLQPSKQRPRGCIGAVSPAGMPGATLSQLIAYQIRSDVGVSGMLEAVTAVLVTLDLLLSLFVALVAFGERRQFRFRAVAWLVDGKRSKKSRILKGR